MVTRLSFAIATPVDPGILIIDEGLGAGILHPIKTKGLGT
jgi:ABC-type polysaccharide/polyol phosphate transport system ATPase subunit